MRTRDRSSGGGGGLGRPAGVPAPALGAPGGERLPVAPRERKPALAALAVLLILLGALGATVMVMRAGDKVGYVEVTASVAAGDKIPESAIREVMLSEDSGLDLITWKQREDLLKNYRAAVTLVPESVLSVNMITDKDEGLTAGKSLVGLSLKDGQLPKGGIHIGDTVAAYYVGSSGSRGGDGGSSGADSSGGTSGGAAQSTLISDKLIVEDIDTDSSGMGGGNVSVTVIADSGVVATLTVAASANDVAIVRVPPSGGH